LRIGWRADHTPHSSDPDSRSYGKHYSAEDIHEIFAPAKQSVDAVKTWLNKAGIEAERISQSVNKQWIQLDLSASEAEQLLQTKYHFYDHAATGKTTIGCDE
jgi:tripeptidyl-peptidase-1